MSEQDPIDPSKMIDSTCDIVLSICLQFAKMDFVRGDSASVQHASAINYRNYFSSAINCQGILSYFTCVWDN